MWRTWLIAALALRCSGYELAGRIDPPTVAVVFLQGIAAPFVSSAVAGADGRFRFARLSAGTYILVVSTAARGEERQTVELSPGTVDPKGRLEVVLRIDGARLESDLHSTGATVPVTVLSIPDRALKQYSDALRRLARHQPEQARECLRRAVEIAPRFAAAWNELGTMAYQASRYTEAETDFRKALDAEPDDFEPLVNLGGVLLNLGRPQEALSYNRQAVARRPGDSLANSQLGLSCLGTNDLDAAEKYLKIAIRLDPASFSHPRLALAEIYLRRGDRPAAIEALRGFLEQHPDSPEAATVRAELARLTAPPGAPR